MKIGVFTVLFAQRPFEEALDYIRDAGVEAVEIGTGGAPGNSHCDLDALVDFLERVVGSGNSQAFMEGLVLPAMAVEASAGGARTLVDPQEGVGLFTLPGFDGTVALLGVADEEAALDEIAARGTVLEAPPGTRAVELKDGSRLLAFADRGYVYAIFPRATVDVGEVMGRIRSSGSIGVWQTGSGHASWIAALRPS